MQRRTAGEEATLGKMGDGLEVAEKRFEGADGRRVWRVSAALSRRLFCGDYDLTGLLVDGTKLGFRRENAPPSRN
jgi:hypothetical protein